MKDQEANVTNVSVYIAALQATFKPAWDARHTTHWFTTDEVYHGHVSQKYPERTHRSEGIEDLRAKPLGKKAPKVGMKVLIKED